MKPSRSYVSRAVSIEMTRANITQSDLAEQSGISQPSLCAIIAGDIRLLPPTLYSITHCWDPAGANIRVLIAHLRDEIRRAGHDPENTVDMRHPHGERHLTAAQRDLADIGARLSDPDVAALIHELATLIRRAGATPSAPAQAAAEAPDPAYSAPPKSPPKNKMKKSEK